MKRTGSDNPNLVSLIHDLKKLSLDNKVNIWRRIAEDLQASTRSRRDCSKNGALSHDDRAGSR